MTLHFLQLHEALLVTWLVATRVGGSFGPFLLAGIALAGLLTLRRHLT